MDAREITAALAGDWNSAGGYGLCPGPDHSKRDRSLKIWDSHQGVRVHSFSAKDSWQDCRRWLVQRGLLQDKEVSRRREHSSASSAASTTNHPTGDTSADALRIWGRSRPAVGTEADVYLRDRGITLALPWSLRFHANLKHGPTGLTFPALVAGVQCPDGAVCAVQRIFLLPDGRDKARVRTPKMTLGALQGGAVRLAEAAEVLALVEGVEDGLAFLQMTGTPAWSVLGTSGFANVVLPDHVRRVILAPDGDAAGRSAIELAGQHLAALDREVHQLIPPEGRDWCDLVADFDERAGIVEYDGHTERTAAERLAWLDAVGVSHE